uniref:Uncharacterized protein n=1 Tax=Daphnia magna TaxID=35525 RepID=A0A0P6IQV4_9CRUS
MNRINTDRRGLRDTIWEGKEKRATDGTASICYCNTKLSLVWPRRHGRCSYSDNDDNGRHSHSQRVREGK